MDNSKISLEAISNEIENQLEAVKSDRDQQKKNQISLFQNIIITEKKFI